jgi:hypothetical protein
MMGLSGTKKKKMLQVFLNAKTFPIVKEATLFLFSKAPSALLMHSSRCGSM